MTPRSFSHRSRLIFRLNGCALQLIAIGALVLACLFWSVAAGAQASPSSPKDGKWKLTWSDEFNGPNGSSVDPSKWVVEVGGEGWGNQELEYYTSRKENVYIHDGKLVIEARREDYTGADGVKKNYTSARMKTAGKFSQAYGRFEARIKIPSGQGMWPAFWMLGDDIDKAGWPACGEIDIMENIGKEPSTIHGSIQGRVIPEAMESKRHTSCRRRDGLPTIFMSSRSSGNQTPFASMSTTISTSLALEPIFTLAGSGYSIIRFF